MATTYNIVEKRYNGTDYDTLYPATKGENLVSPVPVELGGTGATTGAAGMKNLLDALSTVTPTGADLLPLKDVSGNIAGKATIDSILSLVSGGAKIQTGSYVGTGTYGQANPCSLTFDFVPKLLIIEQYDDMQSGNRARNTAIMPLLFDGFATYTSYGNSINLNTSTWYGSSGFYWGAEYFTLSGSIVTWYNASSETAQLNWNGVTYYYLGIG